MQRTLALVKPDAVAAGSLRSAFNSSAAHHRYAGHVAAIGALVRARGLTIAAERTLHMDHALADALYEQHRCQAFYQRSVMDSDVSAVFQFHVCCVVYIESFDRRHTFLNSNYFFFAD
jgi:nucleoside diphosphate kinase